jgi:uncharacterized protein (DUF885 family)
MIQHIIRTSKTVLFASLLVLPLSACQLLQSKPLVVAPVISPQEKAHAKTSTDSLLESYAKWQLDSSPMSQAYRGLKTNYDKWDDISEKQSQKDQQQLQDFLMQAKAINQNALELDQALSLQVFIHKLEQATESFAFQYHNYPINQMYGLHTSVNSFLVNIHQIDTIKDATHYIERIYGIKPLLNQLIVQIKKREAMGIKPPAFVYENVIKTSENLLKGHPFEKKSKEQNILWESFFKKTEKLKLYSSSENVLKHKLKRALLRAYKPAYKKLIKHLKKSNLTPAKNTGFSQFDQGKAFYNLSLKHSTTSTLNAQEIHELGLQQVYNLQTQILALLPELNLPKNVLDSISILNNSEASPDNTTSDKQVLSSNQLSTLKALFHYTRNESSLYYTDPQQALADSQAYIKNLNQNLSAAFGNIPDIKMQVKLVEPFREASSPVAFYQSPSDDGKRPGVYYMNASKLNEMPKFQFEALAYHETIPGHHLQIIYKLNNKNIPEFRRHSHYTAYSEGWGLYAEQLAKELGGYKKPWNEYGRLLMELWRACRLVLDTGLHAKGWDIEKALEYRLANTPFTKTDSLNAIKRYLVMPGQATAYKIGQLKLLELRAYAEEELGRSFELAKYHDFILELGPLPLNILQQQVKAWVNKQI